MRASFSNLLRRPAAVLLLAATVLAGCATPPTDPDELAAFKENNDPLEPMNRYFFEVNRGLDQIFLKPAAAAYNAALPNPVQNSIRSFLNNLRTPVILVNDALQGDKHRAATTISRFLVNTWIGVFGLFDVASQIGLTYHDEDFGQTLAVAGVPPGPYLMLPLLGPSNPRDLTGRVVDFFLDPLGYLVARNVLIERTAVDTVDTRNRNGKALEALERGSLDFYATIRGASRQRREDEILNRSGKSDTTTPGVIFEDENQ
jgi:phospholipid-binding lipoprotein MlaA